MKLQMVYITCKNAKQAEKIANALLKARLIACANIIPKITSLYQWQGKGIKETETLLLGKTSLGKQTQIIKVVEKLHSYAVPCVDFWDVDKSSAKYAKWVEGELK